MSLARDLVRTRMDAVPNWALCQLQARDESGRVVLDIPLGTVMVAA